MGQDTQTAYFRMIAKVVGGLLSVNHDADKQMTGTGHRQQWNLSRLAESGFAAGPRQAFRERDDYVTRLFRNVSPGAAPPVWRRRWLF